MSTAHNQAEDGVAGGASRDGEDLAHWPLGRLLSVAARLVQQDWNTWLAGRGLTHAGLLALHALEDGPHTQRELAAACMVEEQTMRRVLDRLVRAGHVTRERDAADRRRLVVRRTPAGHRAYRSAMDADVADRLVTEHLEDPGAFARMLVQLVRGRLAERSDAAPGSEGTDPA